jgi:hypothetical protein
LDAPDVQALTARARVRNIAAEVEGLALRWRRDDDPAAGAAIVPLLVQAGVLPEVPEGAAPTEPREGA